MAADGQRRAIYAHRGTLSASPTRKRPKLPPPIPPVRRLVLVSSPDRGARGRAFVLGPDRLVIGRGQDGPGGIEDASMSRAHFEVRPRALPGQFELFDLSSSNGTFVNGHPLRMGQALVEGDVVAAGDSLFILDGDPDPDALPAAEDAIDDSASRVIGESLATIRLRRSIATVAAAEGSVLLLGETGVGKEIVARAIHEQDRPAGPWVPVNCASIPAELAESQLFGHRRGTFTGATHDHEGYFAEADGGTLFLDEVGELVPGIQAKLLRVLETGFVRPVGGEGRRVDVRVVSATNRDVEEGDEFRADLLARLGGWTLRIPPLRARRTDILPLFEHFWQTGSIAAAPRAWTVDFDQALLLYEWAANVRELKSWSARWRSPARRRVRSVRLLFPSRSSGASRGRTRRIRTLRKRGC